MRCPKCGNDVSKDDFVCIYCSTRLKEEFIERFKIFRRIDEKWINPASSWQRFKMVFTDPSRAFWDITHYREKIGSFKVLLFTVLLFGLWGVIYINKITIGTTIDPQSGLPVPNAVVDFFFHSLAFYMVAFLWGFFYFGFFFMISIAFFSIGANISINLSKRVEKRYGRMKLDKEEGEEKSQTMKDAVGTYLGELPDYLRAQKSKKTSIMLYGFAPMIVAIGISAIILLFLPTVVYDGSDPAVLNLIFNSPIWGIVDWLQIIVLIGWVPILMSIALRDIANASTLRVYISCVIIAVIICLFFYFLRPTILFGYVPA